MKTRPLVAALAAYAAPAAAILLGAVAPARAQSATDGAIQGVVTARATGAGLAGVTVSVTSPALQGTQSAVTDERGAYKLSALPPGEYTVTFVYLAVRLERRGVGVGVGGTTPLHQRLDPVLDPLRPGGELVQIEASAPLIDPTSTARGATLGRRYLRNVPLPGRSAQAALDAAPGAQRDPFGAAFSGSTSLENRYLIDGFDATGLTLGGAGPPVPLDFIEEIEVLTGGYGAELGRATGGVVGLVTRRGANELRGSIFSAYRPGFLAAGAAPAPAAAGSIDLTTRTAYQLDVGFEVGGPIVRDRLWYYVGFAPRLERDDLIRTTRRRTDCRRLDATGALSACGSELADGQPDRDPDTGLYLTEELDREVRADTARTYHALGRLDLAAAPDHRGQLSILANPQTSRRDGVFGPAANGLATRGETTLGVLRWISRWDGTTELEGVAGWQRARRATSALDPALADRPLQVLHDGQLGTWGAGFGSESARTLAGCDDGPGDRYPLIANCPMDTAAYVVGGPGLVSDELEERRAARIGLTHREAAAGTHELGLGLDLEDNRSVKVSAYSGGAYLENLVGAGTVIATRGVQLLGPPGSPAVANNTDPRFDDDCAGLVCDHLGGGLGAPGTRISNATLNWGAYLRDVWQVRRGLTLSLGLRYEEQRLRYARELQGRQAPLTGDRLGTNAMVLAGNWAPRAGVVYDWTGEGRAKLHAHWGRFYESIPMDINDRSFSGETTYEQVFLNAAVACGGTDPAFGGTDGERCLGPGAISADDRLIGSSGVLVAPGIRAQYLDEAAGGVEYQLPDGLALGAALVHRRLGRVIEDISTDGARSYVIANPGEWSAAEEDGLRAQIERTDDPAQRQRLEERLAMFRGIRAFPRPHREHAALQLTLRRRFGRALDVRASYTYARTRGNYPGLYSPDNGQADPNVSSQYDLPELLANRDGALPYDRPHQVKLDGYYVQDLGRWGELTIGARARAQSGVPVSALGAHYLYGADESFLLPRGRLGRTALDHSLDLHIGYRRAVTRRIGLEVWLDVINAYDHQGAVSVDDTYAPQVKLAEPGTASGAEQSANPVSGGTYDDLIYVKAIGSTGTETAEPIGRNPSFRRVEQRQPPGYALIGARLTF